MASLMGFDFGTARIGVAVGETETGLAQSLEVIDAADNATRFARIGTLLAQWQPARLIVGLPCAADGTETELSARCRRFAHQLEGRYGLPVELIDERLSSVEAEQLLRDSASKKMRDWRARKTQLDAVAAQIILQTYLTQGSP